MSNLSKSVLGIIAVLALAMSFVLPASAAPGGQGARGLSKHDRELLAEARAQGQATVTLLIAAKPGATRTLATGLANLGGAVRHRDDDVNYIRAIVPIDQVEAAAKLNGVQAVEVDEATPLDDPRPDASLPAAPQPAPGASTPNANPYMPIQDIRASDFLADNPLWDGRGVTLGIVDTGVTLDHPSLLTTSAGERKIVDWKTYTDPLDPNPSFRDPTWLNMKDQVSGAVFTYKDVIYTAPVLANYRIGLFNERDPFLGGEVGNDVNRDGNPGGSKGIFAVLWDTVTNNVYVDTNQNNSFADEQAMTDYGVRYDVGTFGTDDPATGPREAMRFVVQTDGKNKFVNIGIVSGAHGSHVAGIAAGNSLFGGAMSGVAPGAKLISARGCLFVVGCPNSATTEALIWLAKEADVDAINMSIGGLPGLNDGGTTRSVIINRLIEQYKVSIFFSAGNSGPGINTVGDPSVTTDAMSVGSYITKASWQSNYGADAPEIDNLHHYSSRGPREDGGFKPQIVASGSAVSTTPMWQAGSPVPGTYTLPAGYAMFNGTSMASPQAAGAAGLLISAANQTGVQKQPDQIRQAMNSSARFLDPARFLAYDQGNGLLNVEAAWNLLKTNIKTVDITSSVPVNTVLTPFMATPNVGTGIHDREGVKAGTSYIREYTFTRTSGGSKAVTYNLTWVGNDDTFSSAGSVALPLNEKVTLNVTVNAATAGAHSAILNLDDPNTTGIDYQTMNVVTAPDEFSADNSYSVTKSGTISRSVVHHYFFRIPKGTPAFKVDFTGGGAAEGAGQVRFLRWHPWGQGWDSAAVSNCYVPSQAGCTNGDPNSRTVANPTPGVWEVTVDARRSSDSDNVPYTLTASILGASVSPNPDEIGSATIGTPVARSYTLTNLFGAFIGRAEGTKLGSARRGTFTINHLELQEYEIEVPAGTTSLRATIGGTSDPAADLDLFVDNCTSGSCVQAGSNADGDSEESVTINNPAAGRWRVRVDGFAVPDGKTEYKYIDLITNPTFGTIDVTDANAERPAGSSWTVPASVAVTEAPASGRVLYGNVQVRTNGNVLVGSGDVVVQSITP